MPDFGFPNTSSPNAAPSNRSGERRPAVVPGRSLRFAHEVPQIDARWRLRITAVVFVLCVLLLSVSPLKDWPYRALLALLVVVSAALTGGSLWSARTHEISQRSEASDGGAGSSTMVLPPSTPLPPRHDWGQEPQVELRQPVNGPGARAPSVRSMTQTPIVPTGLNGRPLRIGKGSKAHASVWRLPGRPVQSGVAADEAQIGDLAIRAASVVGAGHRLDDPGVPRQDAYRIARDVAGGCLVAAVADGVSSGECSEIGAAAAAAASVSHLCHQLADSQRRTNLNFRAAFEQAAAQVQQTANKRRLAAGDVATVLMTCAVPAFSQTPEGSRIALFAWVGDLSAWILRDGRWTHAAGDRKRELGGITTNAVAHALPQSPGAVRTGEATVMPGDVLLVVSDGVGDALESFPQLREYFVAQWQEPPVVSDFLADLQFDAPQSLDDRTGIAIWVGRAPGGRR